MSVQVPLRVEWAVSQVIQCRHKVAHQRHKKKWDLQNIFLDEADPIDEALVPRRRVKGHEPCDGPQQDPNSEDLGVGQSYIQTICCEEDLRQN